MVMVPLFGNDIVMQERDFRGRQYWARKRRQIQQFHMKPELVEIFHLAKLAKPWTISCSTTYGLELNMEMFCPCTLRGLKGGTPFLSRTET